MACEAISAFWAATSILFERASPELSLEDTSATTSTNWRVQLRGPVTFLTTQEER